MEPIVEKVEKYDIPHHAHADFIDEAEDGMQEGYDLILDMLSKDITKYLKKKKLAKSDVSKVLRSVPKIEINVAGLEKIMKGYTDAIKWMFLGRGAGKEVENSIRRLELFGKIPSGMIYGTYLQAIDVQRNYYKQLYGVSAPDIHEDILEFALRLTNSRTTRALESTVVGFRNKVLYALQDQVDKLNKKNLDLAFRQAHKIPEKGKDLVEDIVADMVEDRISLKTAKNAIKEAFGMSSESFEKTLDTELHVASASGTHTAMQEIFGAHDPKVRVAIVNVRDHRCCDSCEKFSRNPDGSLKLYLLSELAAAGSNIGKKKNEWKASVGAVHIRCRCIPQYVPFGFAITPEGTIVKETKE